MQTVRFQNTIRHSCQVSGRGYWSGQPIQLTFLPADVDTGIRFVRTDILHQPQIRAVSENRLEMPLRTRLREGNAEVDMVEHVMAALYGMRIDNCLVLCDACEMPGLDGSALAVTLALQQATTERQHKARETRVIEEPIRLGDQRQWLVALPADDHRLHVEYRLDFGPGQTIPSGISACTLTPDTFADQIAAARTFISAKDAQTLQEKGLALHVTDRDLIVFGEQGPINNSLRYSDECARHKLLDLIGDLALCGYDICGRIIACRTGHAANGRMAEKIRATSSKINIAVKAA
jgi:UDP-3-O-[3-hydroxymyristoyl] N-acetylglucosamine deacetylase